VTSSGGEFRTIAKTQKWERDRFAAPETRVDREGAGESKTGNHMRITRNGSRNGESIRKLASARREIDTKKTSGPHKLRRAERCDEPRFYDGMVRSETS
jgi:hypothetical protein